MNEMLTKDVLGTSATDFTLPATDGKNYSFSDIAGKNGTVVVFICNHCPYVKGVIDRLVSDARALMAEGVGFVAISSNDPEAYPDDDFEHMKGFAKTNNLPFPYLYDESQDVAKSYGAVCTPDVFGFDKSRRLQYRGRIDEAGKNPAQPGIRREMLDAMRMVVKTGAGPAEQVAAIGCAIKWKSERE